MQFVIFNGGKSDRLLGKDGLFGELYAVTHLEAAQAPYMQDFLETVRTVCWG
ncbi:hypothetical protein NTG1052_180079 [Candidatus Nitrotoga sp. 1052]|nr:hypothetical protein NTG1052_180079 [Candidatus Nitrotoga sp. 1052]